MPPADSPPSEPHPRGDQRESPADDARLRAMFGQASAGIVMVDLDGRYAFVNDRFCEMIGYASEELVGRPMIDFVHPDDRARDRALFHRLTTEGIPFDIEKRYLCKHGAVTWVHNSVSILRDDAGRPQTCFAVSLDVTLRRDEETRLVALKDKLSDDLDATTRLYNLIVTSAADFAIYTFDRSGRITSWNPGAEAIFGYVAAEALGQPVERLHTPEDRARHYVEHEMEQALQEGRAPCDRWKVRRDGTLFWGNGVVMPLFDGEKSVGFFKIERDVTAQREIQEERVRLLEAERAARHEAESANAAKDRFLASLSHELRTPLAPVQMALFALERERRLTANGRELLKMIGRNLEAEVHLIDDLLDVSRIVHGKLEFKSAPMDVQACVEQAIEVCGGGIRDKQQRLTVDLAAARHDLQGDSDRLRQAFCNLLQNAVKFTPAGGAVSVRSSNPNPRELLVEISDNGVGIDPQSLSTIFSAFEQGSAQITRRYGGLGLGLAISLAVVSGHGGRLTAASDGPGRGATFAVALPLPAGA